MWRGEGGDKRREEIGEEVWIGREEGDREGGGRNKGGRRWG